MTNQEHIGSDDEPEILALARVYQALKDLDESAQYRVLDYVSRRLGLKLATTVAVPKVPVVPEAPPIVDRGVKDERDRDDILEADGDDGVSPVARKWMRRNGLTVNDLSAVFSLGADEIDLVAKRVPGKNNKERMRNVFLLKGLAAYIGTGAARMKDQAVREACEHYSAYDPPNFATNLRSFSSIVSGSKASGYTLTTRGLTEATEVLKVIAGKSVPSDPS